MALVYLNGVWRSQKIISLKYELIIHHFMTSVIFERLLI